MATGRVPNSKPSRKAGSRRLAGADYDALYGAILRLESVAEVESFLRDLLTETEIREICERYKAARMLDAGFSYTEIIAATGLSSTTVARVAAWVKRGTGGYRLAMSRARNPLEDPRSIAGNLPTKGSRHASRDAT